jgi:hypothetical protein
MVKIDEYLIQEGLLDNCIVSVDADGTEVEDGHSTARHVHRVVQLNIKSTIYKQTVHLLFCYQSEVASLKIFIYCITLVSLRSK